MDNEGARARAEARVRDKIGFLWQVGIYVAVNIFFIILDLLTTPGHYWFYWPLIFWGIGLAIHGWKVFFRTSLLRERMVQKELDREMKKP